MTISALINGNSRWVVDGMFIVLIGVFGWTVNKADSKVENHEARIQIIERTAAETSVELRYISQDLAEIKGDLKYLRNKANP